RISQGIYHYDMIYSMKSVHQVKETRTRGRLLQQGLRLEYLSLGWNAIAGTGAVLTGLSTASVALLGFGLDIAIDSLASLILVWRFLQEARGASLSEQAEQRATRNVGITLFIAGLYIAGQAVHALLTHTAPETSIVGVGIAVISVCVLPPLAYGKIRLATQLDSGALRGDGVLTAVGACLAAVTLLGLLVNTTLGWWWADPLAAVLITGVLLREGWRALHQARSSWKRLESQ
ncbi:MAG: hypothetical protein J2P36_39025, partial [Ktedonobacteraceae bacterium]|nr:hypothetical protein [Ktedonobacteraceae bacterium]